MTRVEDALSMQTVETFHAFHSLLTAVSMQYVLDGTQPITLFAVPDLVIERRNYDIAYDLMKDIPKLNVLMGFHIVEGKFTLENIRANAAPGQANVQLETTSVRPLTVTLGATPEATQVGQTHIRRADILCDNGVIHVIDDILWPPGLSLNAFGERSQLHGAFPSL